MLTKESRECDFPALSEKTYLNTAAEGIPPQAVLQALHQYGQDKLLGMDGRKLHEAQWHKLRAQAANAFGLDDDEIGICSCSSEAFNLAAAALKLRAGDEVVINDLDFPAGATPWLQSSCAATVKLWRSHQGRLRVDDLKLLLTPRTRLVSTSLVSFYNGFRLPLAETLAAARLHSPALVAVDITQALGRVTLDLTDVDFIVSSTHKWILGSHGVGLVGVPRSRADQWTVPAGGWFNIDNAFDSDRFERVVTKPGANSFCVGMPNYPAVYAVAAGLDCIQSVGVAAIERAAGELVRHSFAELKRLPVELLTPDSPESLAGIIAFRHPRSAQIHEQLLEERIHVMHHAGRLRIAVHGYNTPADIDRFLKVLREAIDAV